MKAIIGILVLVCGWFPVFTQNNSTIPERDLLVDAQKSLSGATAIGVVSLVSQGIGYGLIRASVNGASTETAVAGLFLGIGGIGIETNSPILIGRASRQIKQWQCPAEDILVKQKILGNINAARSISIVRTVMPLAGIIASRISFTNDADSKTSENLIFGFWAASMVLTLPEIILIESSKSQIKDYQQKVKIGTTEQGLGMIYTF
jgi:hypothetical protein